ncbi:ankyrin repeat domain-containing protein [Wolbachia endosymbiont of Folsomia candida]|uniref:ankyrin repeat domain-containing protein n=1 Tax=Wolbachia endosymbiont of Folsomia candida TaxID=169402 RepID=UPI000A833605|nr:ankyrin repeat domain-containing protein [Wolbachia endosymbiont of Folsomia candida]AWW50860.1 ankyrin repeat domain-containing protein [Wolbachia endosymbiont of Folsomia candida]
MTGNLHLELIKCLINQPGIDINARGLNGKTPLHCAIELDELSLVELLLTQKNINPFTPDDEGKTSLCYARNVERKEILEALINNKYGSEQDSLLHLAAMMGEINAVRYLIRKGVDVNSKNALHHTPLHLAAGIGHANVVKTLVKEGNAAIDVFDARNQTPMHYAVNNKKLEIVKLLLKLGGDVNLVRKGQGSMKLSTLHNAVSVSNYDERDLCLDIVRCLINATGSQVNLQDYENKTPLHYADRLKTIEVLLTREDIDPLVKDDNGKTPFCYAKEGNRPEIIKALMSNKYGADKNSLLHLAAERGYVELLDDILKEGINVNILNGKNQSPIYLAAEKGHLSVVKSLLKKGANPISAINYGIKSNNLELLKILLVGRNISLLDQTSGVNFPTFHALSNRYIERRKVADKKVKKYSNIIWIFTAVSAVTLTIIYADPVIAIVIGILALTVAITISEMSKRYVENEFQKEMSKELERQCEPQEDISILETTQEVEPILDVVNSRCREEYKETESKVSFDDVAAIGRGRR